MLLLVGLGNPGPEYARNRHNVGFMAMDAIVRRHRLSAPRRRFHGEVSGGTIAGEKVIALKPQTFMNESGRAVGEAARFYKLAPRDIIVFYDEIDLAPAKLRIKSGGGAAGHNGIRSIDAQLGDKDYRRVRIGIGHPGHRDRVHGYVLGNFSDAEREWLSLELDAIAEFVPLLVEGRDSDFMSRVVQAVTPKQAKPAPPRKPSGERENATAPEAAEKPPQKEDGAAQTALGAAIGRALARFRGGSA
jgi:PTH1 family peptidyl-tRNA hydrolase